MGVNGGAEAAGNGAGCGRGKRVEAPINHGGLLCDFGLKSKYFLEGVRSVLNDPVEAAGAVVADRPVGGGVVVERIGWEGMISCVGLSLCPSHPLL